MVTKGKDYFNFKNIANTNWFLNIYENVYSKIKIDEAEIYKFALKKEEEEKEYTPEELNVEQSLANHAEKFKNKDYNEHNRDTSKDPFKGTSIEGKD